MIPKRWVVFTDINNKWDALECPPDYEGNHPEDIVARGGRVQSFVNFATKDEAINYTEEHVRSLNEFHKRNCKK